MLDVASDGYFHLFWDILISWWRVLAPEAWGRLHVACLTVHERLHDRTAGGRVGTTVVLVYPAAMGTFN